METSTDGTLVQVEGLSCLFGSGESLTQVITDVDLSIGRSRTLGLVGESGSGKSMLMKSILGIAPHSAQISGRVTFSGTDLSSLREGERRRFLGRHVGIVFQNSATSLNPFVRVGRQIEEASRYHFGLTKAQGRKLAIDLMGAVGLPDPAECYHQYPHQFSGGMKQRIMIATALACKPDLLIADEATTALDVTVQKQVLDLLQTLQQERQMSLILVTHNLGIVAGRTDEAAVMYGGRIVERGPTEALFRDPKHRYTAALLTAIPRADQPAHARLESIPGRPPDVLRPIPGCPFAPRCAAAEARCVESMPPVTTTADNRHGFACYVPVGGGGSVATASASRASTGGG
jgi:peptide/nickel transport system ATP-binding protein